MPEDYDLYYGFTRFAIELNEMEHDQIHLYAPTDTRFRKDQRSVLADTRFRKDQRSVLTDTRFRKDQRSVPIDTRFRKDQRSVLLLINGIRFMSEVIALHTSRSGLDTCTCTGIYMYTV